MLRHATSVEDDAARVDYFKLHLTVYPVAFRQMFMAITSELTSCSDLFQITDHLRKKLHIDSYSQTNDSAISNAFKYHQDSLHINMFAHTPPLTYLKDIKTGRWRVIVGVGEGGVMACANSLFPTPLTPSRCDHRSDGTRCDRIAMMTCTACLFDYGNERNFCDKHAQRRCLVCGIGSFCTEHSNPKDHVCLCHIKTSVPNRYIVVNRNAHCRIPGCESLSEVRFAQTWHRMSESERKLIRPFACPLGIEDATRSDATRDLVVDIGYPTHGGLRLTMSRAFRLAGCNS